MEALSTKQLVDRLARGLELADDVEVVDTKEQALLVRIAGQHYMIGVQKCK